MTGWFLLGLTCRVSLLGSGALKGYGRCLEGLGLVLVGVHVRGFSFRVSGALKGSGAVP